MYNLTQEQIKEILATIENKPLAITDPERLKVKVAPYELINGKARLSIFFKGQKDPELWISSEVAGDPEKLKKVIDWAKARLRGETDKAKLLKQEIIENERKED